MKQNNWSLIEDKIKSRLEQELKSNSRPPIAAFDADGTLWNTDLGEAFFKYQIEQKLLKNLPADPWRHYRDWKESGDPRPAYLWLAQINQGHSITEVRSWAEAAVKAHSPLPIFEEVKKLIEYLHSHKVRVYVVTASVAWAVEPGAKRLGIAQENVLGIRTQVKNNIVTDQQDGLITYREGKIKALLAETQDQAPFLACGNTMGDFALLKGAGLSLAVGAAPEGHELFETEEKLRGEADSHGWLKFQFL